MTEGSEPRAPVVELTVILPAYNEEENIARAVTANAEACRALAIPYEIVAIDDGSADATADRLSALARDLSSLRVVRHPTNRGFGAAVQTGIAAARGRFSILAPADSPYSADTLRPFLGAAPEADLVLGYRVERPGYNLLMRLNTHIYHALLAVVGGVRYRDVNWVQLYRSAIFGQMDLEFAGIVMGAEIVLKAHALGMRIVEVPCPMERRTRGKASASRPSVMLRTGRDLLRLLWRWRFGGMRAALRERAPKGLGQEANS